MEKNVREKDLQLFVGMPGETPPDHQPEDISMRGVAAFKLMFFVMVDDWTRSPCADRRHV